MIFLKRQARLSSQICVGVKLTKNHLSSLTIILHVNKVSLFSDLSDPFSKYASLRPLSFQHKQKDGLMVYRGKNKETNTINQL